MTTSSTPTRSFILDLREEARAAMPSIAPDEQFRAAAVETWLGRMANEWCSQFVFRELAGRFDALAMPTEAEQSRAFEREERQHGVLCGAVVEALGGEARMSLPWPRRLPRHRDASALASLLRNVIHIGCMSETVAVAIVGAERLEMEAGPLHTLLTRIWADEIGHARFAWRLLTTLTPSLSDDDHAAIERYLPIALASLEEHELAHLPVASCPPAGGAAYGLCNGRDARALFFDTVETVIVPGLEERGFAARSAWQRRGDVRATVHAA